MDEKILVLDFGGQYNLLIARRVRELRVYAEIRPYNKITPEEIRQAVTERLPQKFHAINLKAIDIICKGAETL